MSVVEVIEANLNNNGEKQIKLKKACAYCRVSTDEEEQINSYNSQIKHYTDMIKNDPELTFVGIYADEGITGTQMKNRDEFLRMIEDAKNKKIDVIIAKSISRFARNTVDTLNTCRLLRNLNIDVYFEKENIHTLYMNSEMFLTLYSAFAQAESESTSMNVKMGYRAKMKRGEPCGSIACYAIDYNKFTKEITINGEKAEVVRKIFKYYLEGYGSSRICNLLESENILSPSGGHKWHPSVIKSMITNVKYVGDIMGQKFYVEDPLTHRMVKNRGQKPKYYKKDNHPAIIDRDTWEKAQEIYNKRSIVLKNGEAYCPKYSRRYHYSSKIECGLCHRNYVRRHGSHKHDGKKIYYSVYWRCSEYLARTGDCDASKGIRESELDSMFVQLFNEMIENYKFSDDALMKKIETTIYNKKDYNDLKKLDLDEQKLIKKLSHLIDLKLEDETLSDIYHEKESSIKEELFQIKKRREEINSIIHNKKQTQERINQIKELLSETKKLKEFDREIFDTLIERIYIGEIKEDNTKDYSIIRFVLKTGELEKYYRGTTKKIPKKIMSFESDERLCKTTCVSKLERRR